MPEATYKRVLAEVGGAKFYPPEAKYALSHDANQSGGRPAKRLVGRTYLWCDADNIDTISQATQIELWKMVTETNDSLHRVSITYYQEDGDKILASMEFMGWVSVFQYTTATKSSLHSQVDYSNLLYIELAVALDEGNINKHRFTR
jgi:hypothetical protein